MPQDNYRRLNNFDGLCCTSAVASYDPSGCDVQFELVRIPSSSFNPWAPIEVEYRESYYDKLDPWKAEQAREQNLRGVLSPAQRQQPNRYILPQQSSPNRNPSSDAFYMPPKQAGMAVDQRWQTSAWGMSPNAATTSGAHAEGRYTVKNNTALAGPQGSGSCSNCSTCDRNNCSCDKYEYMFSPACGVTRHGRDYLQRQRPTWDVVVAPI